MKKGVIISVILFILISFSFVSAVSDGLINSWSFENNLKDSVEKDVDFKAVSKGDYRVYLSFEVKKQKFEGNWEFKII